MSIKLVDSAVPMNESGYPVARAKHIWFDDDATLQDKLDNKELGGGDSSVTLTQAEYEALPEEERLNGLYYTYDTKRIYKNGVQYGASEPIPLTMEEYKTLKEAGAIDEQQEYLVEADAEGILLGAEDIGYSNAVSNLPCTTVQGAIDKVNDKVDNLIDDEVSDSTVWSSKKTSDELLDILKKVYPIGSVYINVTDINPFDILGFGTWERFAQNMTLWGASDSGQVGTIKNAGLPNITGEFGAQGSSNVLSLGTGAFRVAQTGRIDAGYSENSNYSISQSFDASRSSAIYGKSNTVQPPALVVNIWKRTA